MLTKILFRQIDNSPLIVFRVLFGILICAESFGAIATGWVKRILIDPKFTFNFIGFEWLQPLPDNWMYVYYVVMGIFGLGVLFGYKYRWSIISFTILWSATYFMQKSAYNNHYYLLMLLSAFMCFVPANRYASLDAKRNPNLKSIKMPFWVSLIFIVQISIVYVYAAIAKLYPDWLDATFVEIILKPKKDYWLVGELFQQKWFHYFIAYSGLLFDFLIAPLLLIKATRKWAFVASIFFHFFNSLVFHVGIFPYLALSLTVFFFSTKTIHSIFLKKKAFYKEEEVIIPKYSKVIVMTLLLYFGVQDLLPWRHWIIKDNVVWTEEGHRLSWRMMLRAKSGSINFKVVDKESGKIYPIRLNKYLTDKQRRSMATKPDFIWQFSQRLKKEFAEKNIEVSIYVISKVSVNGRPYQRFIDPEVDLAATKWNVFKHNEWILPSNLD